VKRKIFYRVFVLLLLPFFLFADVLEKNLEKKPESALVLNTVVLHGENESYRTGIHPINAVEFLGSVGSTRKLYTSYISTNGKDTKVHSQQVKLFDPKGHQVWQSVEKTFNVGTFSMHLGPFQRGYLEQELKFPALNKSDPSNFGVYRLKIFLDGRLQKIFYIPFFAQ